MPAIEDRSRHVLSPLYLQLFNLIGQLEGGVKFLVVQHHITLHNEVTF